MAPHRAAVDQLQSSERIFVGDLWGTAIELRFVLWKMGIDASEFSTAFTPAKRGEEWDPLINAANSAFYDLSMFFESALHLDPIPLRMTCSEMAAASRSILANY